MTQVLKRIILEIISFSNYEKFDVARLELLKNTLHSITVYLDRGI